MNCRNTLTDLFHFSARDLARIERPLTHHILPVEKDTVEGKVTMKFDGVWYWKYISVPRNHPDLKGAYSDALMEAMAAVYRQLPLSDPFRPWHWHEFAQ